VKSIYFRSKFWGSKTVVRFASQKAPLYILLYTYLITNEENPPSGIYKFDLEECAFQTGMTEEVINEGLKALSDIGKILTIRRWIFVVESLWETFKLEKGTLSSKLKISIDKQLSKRNIPKEITCCFYERYCNETLQRSKFEDDLWPQSPNTLSDTLSHTVSGAVPDESVGVESVDKRLEIRDLSVERGESERGDGATPNGSTLGNKKLNTFLKDKNNSEGNSKVSTQDKPWGNSKPGNVEHKPAPESKIRSRIEYIFRTFNKPLGNSRQDQINLLSVFRKQIDRKLPEDEMLFQLESFHLKNKEDGENGQPNYLQFKNKEHMFNGLLRWLDKADPNLAASGKNRR
jgi:hypothetical protein